MVAIVAAAAPVRAQEVKPDTAIVTPAPPDSTPADTSRSDLREVESALLTVGSEPRRTRPTLGRFDKPHWVMLRSLALPGWGQIHNQAWIKAPLIGGADLYLRVRVIHDMRQLSDLSNTADATAAQVHAAEEELAAAKTHEDSVVAQAKLVTANTAYNATVIEYNTLLDQSINRRWLLATVVLYSMIDAYVDAHFKNFDVDLRFLPVRPAPNGLPGMQFRLRWKL